MSFLVDIPIYLCAFHRLQNWNRWLRNGYNGCLQFRDEIMALLCAVADSETEEEYEINVDKLKDSVYWENCKGLRDYYARQWEKKYKVNKNSKCEVVLPFQYGMNIIYFWGPIS